MLGRKGNLEVLEWMWLRSNGIIAQVELVNWTPFFVCLYSEASVKEFSVIYKLLLLAPELHEYKRSQFKSSRLNRAADIVQQLIGNGSRENLP